MLIYFSPLFLFSLLASLEWCKVVKINNFYYFIIFLTLGFFSGSRMEVGQDWPAYVDFFDSIDVQVINFNIILNSNFESGYFLYNYIVKYFGGNCVHIFLIASLFLNLSIFFFVKQLFSDKSYFLIVYYGYAFYILNFAQIRQAIAIGFFILGFRVYLINKKIIIPFLVILIGVFFQYSALLYIVLFLVIYFRFHIVKLFKFSYLTYCFLFFLILTNQLFDYYNLLSLFATEYGANKIEIYKDNQNLQGVGQYLYAVYLTTIVIYINKFKYLINQNLIVIEFSILALLVTILFIFIFPGSYVMYSRAYVLASIFQSISMSLIFKRVRNNLHLLIYIFTSIVSYIYLYRVLDINADDFLPYKSFIF